MVARIFSRGRSLALLAVLLVLYLLSWPVPIDPVVWHAPQDLGLVDSYAPNDALAAATIIDLGVYEGPEDIAGGPDEMIYASTADGDIIRIDQDGKGLEPFVNVGGRPLGIDFDAAGNLLVANSMVGLQRVSASGEIELLLPELDDRSIVYPNDVAVAANGKIYLTQASSKFTANAWGNDYAASLLDILEHGDTGKVFEVDPISGSARVIMKGLSYANGVAVSADQRYLLVNELSHYRVWRYWLQGSRAGSSELVLENLPGFPDNINTGLDGRFWIGLVAPRNSMIDAISDKPWVRKVVQRLPAFLRPSAVPSSHVIAINGDGQVLMNLQDTSVRVPTITGAHENAGHLYLSTLFGARLAILDRADFVEP